MFNDDVYCKYFVITIYCWYSCPRFNTRHHSHLVSPLSSLTGTASSSCYWGWSSPARGRSGWPWCRPPAPRPSHTRCRSWRCRPGTTGRPADRREGPPRPRHRRPVPPPRHTRRRRAGCSPARTGPAGRSCRPSAPTAAPWSPSAPCCARYSQFSGPTRLRSSLKDETPRYPQSWPRKPRQCSAGAWPVSPASAGRYHWPGWRCWSSGESWCLRCWIPVRERNHKTSSSLDREAPGGGEALRLLSHHTRLSVLWECPRCLWRTEGWKYFDEDKDFPYLVAKYFLLIIHTMRCCENPRLIYQSWATNVQVLRFF